MTQRETILNLLKPHNRVLIKTTLVKKINPTGAINWGSTRLKRINHLNAVSLKEAEVIVNELAKAGLKIKDHD